jgi:hypothetical protein
MIWGSRIINIESGVFFTPEQFVGGLGSSGECFCKLIYYLFGRKFYWIWIYPIYAHNSSFLTATEIIMSIMMIGGSNYNYNYNRSPRLRLVGTSNSSNSDFENIILGNWIWSKKLSQKQKSLLTWIFIKEIFRIPLQIRPPAATNH